jgi:hypothetical protein
MYAGSKIRKENHIQLFSNMAKTGNCKEVIFKEVFGLEKSDPKLPPFLCYACEEVGQNTKHTIDTEKCKKCPVDWGTFEKENHDAPCCRIGSPYFPIATYRHAIDSDINRRAAKEILDLPFRKDWKEESVFLFRGRPVKVGDILFNIRKGLMPVVSIEKDRAYSIYCGESFSITDMGFYTISDKFPSLFWPDEIQNFPSIFSEFSEKKKIKKSNTVYINKYKRSIHAHDTQEQADRNAILKDRLGPAVPFTYEWEE